MDAFNKLLGPIIGSTVGAFHLNSNSHRTGDCPCKLQSVASSIWTAAETNDFETLSKRIASNASLVDKLDAYGYTALHYAAQHNHVRIVKFLLQKGCPPDSNGCGATPLHRAAYSGSVESCKLLLKAGADPNATDSSFKDMGSCLHKAYSVANVAVVELLLANGADPLQRDGSGQIPEHLLKKKYLGLFIGVGSNRNAGFSTKFDLSTGAKSSVDIGSDDADHEVHDFEPTPHLFSPVASMESGIAPAAKVNEMGLICTLCNQHCISFTRLTDGSLLCTKCRYKV